LCIAQRSLRYQPRASMDRSHVAADGGIDGGAQLRLLSRPVWPCRWRSTPGLSFGQRAEHAHRGFERGQLAVGMKMLNSVSSAE